MSVSIPVLVYAMVGTGLTIDFAGSFPIPKKGDEVIDVVGMLPAINGSDLNACEAYRRHIERPGARFEMFVVRGRLKPNGLVECLIGAQVLVDDMDAARKLPGFLPFYISTEDQYVTFAFEEQRRNGVKPLRVSHDKTVEEYTMPHAAVPPPYDGMSAVVSAIPSGIIAAYVFLEEEPDKWYFVSGMPVTLNNEVIIESARRLRNS
jgi:hypothetical protein